MQVGIEMCRARVTQKLWELEGYRLQCELAQVGTLPPSAAADLEQICDLLLSVGAVPPGDHAEVEGVKILLLRIKILASELDAKKPAAGDHVERIARVCHAVNRDYCAALGDTSQPAWADAPDWQKGSAMLGVKLHLGNPNAGLQASHESWMAQKVADGWVYGAVKDPEAKTHPCIVPFAELPREQKCKDYIFRAVVHALA